MKKVICWVAIFFTCLTLIGVTVIFFDKKNEENNEKIFHSFYDEVLPDINAYPDIKQYYLSLFNQGLIYESTQRSDEELHKNKSQIFAEAEIVIGYCNSKLFALYESGELNPLNFKKLDNETNAEGYESLNLIIEEIRKIPPITKVLNQYKTDKKITDRELCTLENMYDKSLYYKYKLVEQANNKEVKSQILEK